MRRTSIRPPLSLVGLVIALVVLALGGFYGGVAMLSDPTGSALDMADVLPLLPVRDYTLPGLFLILAMGITPLAAAFALVARPAWPWLEPLSRRHHWSWSVALGIGLVLLGWLALQAVLIGFRWPIQFVTAGIGVAIVGLALAPGVRRSLRTAGRRA